MSPAQLNELYPVSVPPISPSLPATLVVCICLAASTVHTQRAECTFGSRVWPDLNLLSHYPLSISIFSGSPFPNLAPKAKTALNVVLLRVCVEGLSSSVPRDILILKLPPPRWPSCPCGHIPRQRAKHTLSNFTLDIGIDAAPSHYSV